MSNSKFELLNEWHDGVRENGRFYLLAEISELIMDGTYSPVTVLTYLKDSSRSIETIHLVLLKRIFDCEPGYSSSDWQQAFELITDAPAPSLGVGDTGHDYGTIKLHCESEIVRMALRQMLLGHFVQNLDH